MRYFLSVSFIALILLAGCSGEKVKPSIDPSLNAGEIPSQESWNSVVFFSDSGKTRAILHAGHMRVYDKSMETLLDKNMKVEFFNEDGEKTSTLTAKRGKVNDETKDLFAYDSVVVVSDSGTVINTEELMFRNKDKKIVSDKFVTITSPKETIKGYGFESDQALRNYVIFKVTYTARTDTAK